ncbi:LytR family transcriptional regulator [Nocardioides silvaticus]|uniref:LytR family transcriptional regulator n=1 Tax=Nocardioides silvaticus TaxID=2201891 RepID=A0A316TR57_9ACTN|nr:LCP family protein [Nocardioides silvaticus]PWN02066.1 LytR family transcriptional regulator [Nocardioides silvaticus]
MSENSDVPGAPSSDPEGGRRWRARRSTSSVTTSGVAGKRRLRKRHTVAKVITATLVALAIGTATSVVLAYNHWNSNLDVKDLDPQLGTDRPPKEEVEGPKEPMNILVMGSDSRDCQGCNIDGLTGDGERSDTTIMLHLSADRKRAYGISVPRDTLVDRPTCYDEDGGEIPGADDVIWNEAYAVGGPACTIRQFEQVTGVRIDNYVVIDFQGFKDMVNALDGVEVCIPQDIVDTEHGITLDAGTREIKGDEALSYVRVRHVGNGTDPERIRRQQAFMAAMINKAISAGMLARPDRMLSFLNAVTESIQTDYKNIGELSELGQSFQGIGLDNIKFLTTPWVYSTAQEGRVEWTPEVNALWKLVIGDKPLSEQFAEQAITAADDPSGSDSSGEATQDPSQSPGGGGKKDRGLSDDARESAGLCT